MTYPEKKEPDPSGDSERAPKSFPKASIATPSVSWILIKEILKLAVKSDGDREGVARKATVNILRALDDLGRPYKDAETFLLRFLTFAKKDPQTLQAMILGFLATEEGGA